MRNKFQKILALVLAVGMLSFVRSTVTAQQQPPPPGGTSPAAPAVRNQSPAAATPAATAPDNPDKVLTSPAAPAAAPAPALPAAPADAASAASLPNNTEQMGPPTPINLDEPQKPLEERLKEKITLDVRDMSIIDVLKFLALKGNINMVTAGNIQGRATFYLKGVSIKDAMDIAVLTSRLAYVEDRDIIRVMTDVDYEALYGKKFNDRNVVEIVRLKYAKPSYVLAALDNLKTTLGRIIIDEDTGSVVMIDTPESVERMQKTLSEMEGPLEPFVFKLQYSKADVVAEQLKPRIDAHSVGTVSVNLRTNSLVVRALPDRRKEVEKLIKELDQPTKEVLVEARVLQIVFKPQYNFGIDWNIDFRDSSFDFLRKMSFQNVLLNDSTLTSSSALGQNYLRYGVGTVNVDSFNMAIRALKQVSNTKILSSPKILVTNNEEAKIHVGDTVPYIISTTSGTGDNAITSEDVRFVDVGMKLNVTPIINDNGFVTMVLKPEISTVVGNITSKGGGIPQVNKTTVETTVMIKDGQTIVLGGLKKDNKVQTKKGLPILMDIPVVRKFFSSESESLEATEIVIFITPHILTGDENAKQHRGDIKPSKEYKDEVFSSTNRDLKLKR